MNKTALITGGTRGIGLGIAGHLAREGWNLALCGRRDEAAVAEVIKALRTHSGEVLYVPCDIGDSDARTRLMDAVRERFNGLNLLINNAGVAPLERLNILEAGEESFERVLRTNLQGPYFLTQAAARWMIEKKEHDPAFTGCIISINSVSSTMASPNRGEYCISKAGLSMATKLWAVQLGAHGIPVYEVSPGIITTDMTAGVKEKYDRLIEEGLLVQPRWGTPDDVGRAVAMLARGDLPYSTGQVIMVDGGLTLPRL